MDAPTRNSQSMKDQHADRPVKNVWCPTASPCCRCRTFVVGKNWLSEMCTYGRCCLRCCTAHCVCYFLNFVLWPTNAQLSHKLSHCYMFRHHHVILRELVINTLPNYTCISNAAVGNTIYNEAVSRYWLQAPWGWHDSVETCSSVKICEIIVHCWS
jgi:hypothetical protein